MRRGAEPWHREGRPCYKDGRGWGPAKPRAVPWEWIRRQTSPHSNVSCSRASRCCNTRGFGRGEHRRQRATCERLSKRGLHYAGHCSTAGGALPRCPIYLYNQEAINRYSHHIRQEQLALYSSSYTVVLLIARRVGHVRVIRTCLQHAKKKARPLVDVSPDEAMWLVTAEVPNTRGGMPLPQYDGSRSTLGPSCVQIS